jgi:hypothetical protein
MNSLGIPAASKLPWARALFEELLERLRKEADVL